MDPSLDLGDLLARLQQDAALTKSHTATQNVLSESSNVQSAGKPVKKDLSQLKQEFKKKCADLENEYTELGWKATDGWKTMTDMLNNRDTQNVKNHNENIDTLLVFAGLFSAILTAFIIEAIKLLQSDSSDTSLRVLVQISQQLGSFTLNNGFANSTYIPLPLPTDPFVPETSSVWVNGLWIVALVLSLVATSLGMLIKQWLREFIDNPYVVPEEQRRVRLFRVRGLRKYKVSEIATFLPLLLQISLILFFAGLVLFVRNIHGAIGWVITGFVVSWFSILIVTTALPLFSPSCPYKTPFLKPITSRVKKLLDVLYRSLLNLALRRPTIYSIRVYFLTRGTQLSQRSNAPPRAPLFGDEAEAKFSRDSSLDPDIFLDTYKTFGNINIWEMVMQCLDPEFPSKSLQLLFTLINKSPSTPLFGGFRWLSWMSLYRNEQRMVVKSMIMCIRWAFISSFEGRGKPDHTVVEALLALKECTEHLRFPSSRRIDEGLYEMASTLIREVQYVPFDSGPLVKYVSGVLESDPDVLRMWEGVGRDFMNALVEAFDQTLESSRISEVEFLKRYCNVFFCAGRAAEDGRQALIEKSAHLSECIISEINSLPDPSGPQSPSCVFLWHCALDMALRLHIRDSDVMDKTVFDALHTRSVKMFDLYLQHAPEDFGKSLVGKPVERSQTSDVLIEAVDWDQVLDKYVEVEIRKRGEYAEDGRTWDYKRLRVDHKDRMEFMLNYGEVGRFEVPWR